MSRDDPKRPKAKKQRVDKPLLERLDAAAAQPNGGAASNAAAAASDGGSKFARALGSVDYQTREKGVEALSLFLQHRRDIGELDMLKLWKGLFFCFWHSDKAPVQVCVCARRVCVARARWLREAAVCAA